MKEHSFPSPLSISRLALLVDGENMSSTHAANVLTVARKFGEPAIRRVYGKIEHIAGWDQEGFRLVPTRPGKNAADLLLTVEAMTLALKDGVETLIIASSDGDFVYLATQLRELSCTVIGIGLAKAPSAFRASCSRFVPLSEPATPTVISPPPMVTKHRPTVSPTKIIPVIRSLLPSSTLCDGWAYLAWVEHKLREKVPNFDPADYGQDSLERLIVGVNFFELDRSKPQLRLRDPSAKSAAMPRTPQLQQQTLKPHTAP